MLNNNSKLARMAGYTIDQTILIVAVIAILITLVIASVGWDILTRAGGTKLASNLRQIEDSIGMYYSDNGGIWPPNAVALTTGGTSGKNYVPGFAATGGTATTLDHDFGAGGTITLTVVTNTAANTPCPGVSGAAFQHIALSAIPETEAVRADASVDGEDGNAAGRMYWTAPGSGVSTVTANYCANQL